MPRTTSRAPRDDWPSWRDAIDLAAVATSLLGPAPGRRGERGLWWSCPTGAHPDRNPSFKVYRDREGRWRGRCFGCGANLDAAALVMAARGSTFPEARAYLCGGPAPGPRPLPRPAPRPEPAPEAPAGPEGMAPEAAAALVEEAERRLWGPQGAAALAYLTGPGRLLTPETIRAARLGYAPRVEATTRDGHPYVASGIVVPWLDGDAPALVKVRQADGRRPKYAQVYRDPARLSGLYPGPEAIRPGRPLVVVEGEFDALLLAQELGALAAVATLGSASARPGPAVLARMLSAAPWLVATDADPAGDRSAEGWPAAHRRVRPPAPWRDWTEARAARVELRRWWGDVLSGSDDPPAHTRPELAGWRWGPAEGDRTPGLCSRGDAGLDALRAILAQAADDPDAIAEREAIRAESRPATRTMPPDPMRPSPDESRR